jgi:hypothetical protein
MDGTFVSWPARDTARLTEAFRRAVLRLFVRMELFDEDQAAGMLTWPHSGSHVHTAVWVPEDDRTFATRLARYGARNPVALIRLTYDRSAKAVTYRSDKSEGANGGHRDRRPAGVPGPGAGPHPRQRARHDAVLWQVCQSPPWHAPEGGADPSRGAAGDRPRTTAGPNRGIPPVGDPATADLRGRPARVPDLPRRDAPRRVQRPGLGEPPDPHPPPHPRLPCGARDPRRREEPPIDAGSREPRGVAFATSISRRPDRPLSMAPPPRRHAGKG